MAGRLTRSAHPCCPIGQLLPGSGVLLAIAGTVALFSMPGLRCGRIIGLACLTSFATLLVLHGKSYYAGPVFPALFAAGAMWLESWVVTKRASVRRASSGSAWALLAVYAAAVLPFGLPVLPPPQDYADMLGWENQVRTLAGAYRALPPADRARTVLAAANYGEAGVIDYYGPRHGLPGVVSSAGSY